MSILDKFAQIKFDPNNPTKPSGKPESFDVPENSADKDRILDPESAGDVNNPATINSQPEKDDSAFQESSDEENWVTEVNDDTAGVPTQFSTDWDVKNPEKDFQQYQNDNQDIHSYKDPQSDILPSNTQHPAPLNTNEKSLKKHPWLIDMDFTNLPYAGAMSKYVNASQEQEEGAVLFYVDPKTRDIVYATNGYDNPSFYSYVGLKTEGALAYPTSLSHYDLWFNRKFTDNEIKSFQSLIASSDSAFFYKAAEIEGKLRDWSRGLTYGVLSPGGRKLSIAMELYKHKWVTGICAFFENLGLTNDDTLVYCNNRELGNLKSILGSYKDMGNKMEVFEPNEDADLLNLVQAWKNRDPNAGEKLIERYERMISRIVNDYCKSYKLNSHDKEDMLQNAYVHFLTKLDDYDPTLGKLSTFAHFHVSGMIRNSLNRAPNKELNLTVEKATQNDEMKNLINSSYLHDIVDELPDRLKIAVSSYFFKNETLDVIGKKLNLSKERVRQLIMKGIDELRFNPKVQELDFYKIANLKTVLITFPEK